jgi:hypothetical protein
MANRDRCRSRIIYVLLIGAAWGLSTALMQLDNRDAGHACTPIRVIGPDSKHAASLPPPKLRSDVKLIDAKIKRI